MAAPSLPSDAAPEPTPEPSIITKFEIIADLGWKVDKATKKKYKVGPPQRLKQVHNKEIDDSLRSASNKSLIAKRSTKGWQWERGSDDHKKAKSIIAEYIQSVDRGLQLGTVTADELTDAATESDEDEAAEATATQDSSCAIVSFL